MFDILEVVISTRHGMKTVNALDLIETVRENPDFEYTIFEYPNLSLLNTSVDIFEYESLFNEILELNDIQLKFLESLVGNHFFSDYQTAVDNIESVVFHDKTPEEFAEEYINLIVDIDSIPDIIMNNIDYKSVYIELDAMMSLFQTDGYILEFQQ